MMRNLKWSCSILMFLMAITNFRCVLSSEVVAPNYQAIQSVDRHFIDIFNEGFDDQMALESRSNEGHPLSILKPPSGLQGSLQNATLNGQESHQVAAIVLKDPQTAASEHSHHKDHSSGFKKSSGHEGNSGFKNNKGYEGSNHGNHAKKEDKGFYDKGGKKWGGAEHKSKYHAKKESGKKGSKGHKHGIKGHQNKGSKTKGFKNVFHKEESGVTSSFYNDVDNKKYSKKYDHLDSYFQAKKGGSEKGSEFKGGKQHASDDKKGFSKKGSAHGEKGGHKSESGKGAHHDHKSSFAEKKGGKEGYGGGHGGHDGHASHSNTVTITASENANKPVILKPIESGDVAEDMVIAEQNEIKDTKKIIINDKRRRKKAREQVKMPVKSESQDADSIEEQKSESVLETAIIKNGMQISMPVSHRVKNGLNDTLSSQVQELLGLWPELKMFQTDDDASDNSHSDSTIVTSTTHEPPKMELIVRKRTPKSKGYSYIKKSSTPTFSNCSTDGSQECTTYTKNSRSTVVVEYTDSDYPDNNEQDYQEETDSDYEQPESLAIDTASNALTAETDLKKETVADIQADSTKIDESTEIKAKTANSIPDKAITHEALLLLLAKLQKAQSSTQASSTPEVVTVLPTTVTPIEANPLSFEIKRRRKSHRPSTVSSTTIHENLVTTKVPEHGPLLERRRQNKVKENNILIEKRKKARELVLELKKNQLEIKEVENIVAEAQNEPIVTNRLTLRGRSAFHERLAARRERLGQVINKSQEEKISELTEQNKVTDAPLKIHAVQTEKPKAMLDISPFLVPDDWDSRRIGETTTVETTPETTTLRSRQRSI